MSKKEKNGMTSDEYIEQRLDHQIHWYDRKSVRNHYWYKGLRTVEIILASCIPFAVGYITDERPSVAFAVGIAGVLVAIISGLLALSKHQENWIEYRKTCEALRHHRYRFLVGSDPYSGDDALQKLVDNIESLVAKENMGWSEYIKGQAREPERD